MREAGADIAPSTLCHFLKTTPGEDGITVWEQVGGEGTIREIECLLAAPLHVAYYFDKVRDAAVRRRLKEHGLRLARTARDTSVDLETLLQSADVSFLHSTPRDRFKTITSAELERTELDIDYLVEGFIVRGQPCIVAGAKKTLKTNILIDLVLSLAQAGLFLGKFRVLRSIRVALLSGESGRATIAETARRIARSKSWGLADFGDAIWGFDLPRLGETGDLLAMRRSSGTDGWSASSSIRPILRFRWETRPPTSSRWGPN